MDTFLSDIAKQIPHFAGLLVIVWFFLQHMSQQAEAARQERTAERAERQIERQNLHVIVERNTAAIEKSIGVTTHMDHVLRRLDGERIPHTGSHIWAHPGESPLPRPDSHK